MMEFLGSLTMWHWLIAAAVFFVLELVAPGAFMLWLGLSSLLVGLISYFVVWPWQYQLVTFAVFAIVSPAILVFLWMLSLAFKPEIENIAYPPIFIPESPTLANFARVFEASC